MPASLTDNYVANTYKGVLHVNGEELPAGTKVQVYDGAGNQTAIKLGAEGVDCLSLSANGLIANDLKYPDKPGNRFNVLCQTSDNAAGEINTLELKDIQDILRETRVGLIDYVKEEPVLPGTTTPSPAATTTPPPTPPGVIPVITVERGVIETIREVVVTQVTQAAGGISLSATGNFNINKVGIDGGIVKELILTPVALSPQPNLLINAQGIVNQRQFIPNESLANIPWNPNRYFLDRWRSNAGNPINWSYNINGNIVTITAPANPGVSQVIEKVNIIPGIHSLSWRGTAFATILEKGVEKATGLGGTGEIKTITAILAGDGDVEIKFTSGTFSLPKFERGGTQTQFDYRDFGSELRLCQRYFCKSYGYTNKPGTIATTGAITSQTTEPVNPTLHNNGWRFPVNLRARIDNRAWVFNPRDASINEISFYMQRASGTPAYGARAARVASWSDTGISSVDNTGEGLGVDTMRVYEAHYVADAEF